MVLGDAWKGGVHFRLLAPCHCVSSFVHTRLTESAFVGWPVDALNFCLAPGCFLRVVFAVFVGKLGCGPLGNVDQLANCQTNPRREMHVARTNPFSFLQQVRAEIAKVVWPTRRETVVTTIMCLILVFITAVFFFFIDQLLSYGTGLLFG